MKWKAPHRRDGDDRGGVQPDSELRSSRPDDPAPRRQINARLRIRRSGDSETTLALRQQLWDAHGFASDRASGAQSEPARDLFLLVADTATRWIFTDAPDDALEELVDTLRGQVESAAEFERFARFQRAS